MIRRAGAGDLSEIRELLEEVDTLHVNALPTILQTPSGFRSSEYLTEFISGAEKAAFVAEGPPLSGLLMAYLRGPKMAERPASVCELDTLVVRSSSRRRGVGRALVMAGVAWARERGASRIELGVYEFNETARKFWRAVGAEVLWSRMKIEP